MKLFWEYLGYILLGLAMMVGSVLYLLWADYGLLHGFMAGLAVFLGALFIFTGGWLMRRDWDEMFCKSLPDEVMMTPARLKVKRPYSQLATQFAELAARDEHAVVDDAQGYLAWNSEQFAEIRIQRLGDGGEDWHALFWVRYGQTLTDAQLDAICRKQGFELDEDFRNRDAHGLAIYRDGQLAVYPALKEAAFCGEFMESVLARGKVFREWMEEYCGDNEGDA